MKVDCNICGAKYKKRFCEAHTHTVRENEFRCEENHCRDCCKKAHICILCGGTKDERFKFDWKGTFHPSCFKSGGKLECCKCHKKYGAKHFYDGFYKTEFSRAICPKCIICQRCGNNFPIKLNDNYYSVDHFKKVGELLCYSCLEKDRVCVRCGKQNDTDRCKSCKFCVECGKSDDSNHCKESSYMCMVCI